MKSLSRASATNKVLTNGSSHTLTHSVWEKLVWVVSGKGTRITQRKINKHEKHYSYYINTLIIKFSSLQLVLWTQFKRLSYVSISLELLNIWTCTCMQGLSQKALPSMPFISFSFACKFLFTACSWSVWDQISIKVGLHGHIHLLVCSAHPEVGWVGCPWFALSSAQSVADLCNSYTNSLTFQQSMFMHKPFLYAWNNSSIPST